MLKGCARRSRKQEKQRAGQEQVANALDDIASLKGIQPKWSNIHLVSPAVQQGALQQTIANLPKTLHAALPAFVALNNAFPSVRGLARAFLPAVHSSGPALDAGIPFIKQLRALVSELEKKAKP